MGFDSIAVALLGNSNPIGIVFFSFFITILSKGSTYMNSASGLESEIASVITGIILLFSACNAYIRYLVNKEKMELRDKNKAIEEEKINESEKKKNNTDITVEEGGKV